MTDTPQPPKPWAVALVVLTLASLVLSGINPAERGTWVLEVLPVLVGLPLALVTARRFPLTPLLCVLLTIHGVILMVGGHYTYAKVPLGDWVRDALHLARNHYDRLGHVAQGFVPAILVREILLRTSPLKAGKWLFCLTVSVCLAISASYELFEWLTAIVFGSGASAFLGTQGDEWDTQWDMFLCMCGSLASLLLLAHWHDKQLSRFRAQGNL